MATPRNSTVRPHRALLIGSALGITLSCTFLYLFLQHAWLSDDAFITLRTVSNVNRGYGLTWNTFERVQAYTHPLWMLLLAALHALTNEYVFTVLGLSLFCALAAFIGALHLVQKHTRSFSLMVVTALLLLSSKAWMDYTSSGLENPLLYFIVILFLRELFARVPSFLSLGILTSCAYLARPDAVLLFAPALMYRALLHLRHTRDHKRFIGLLLMGAAPALLWTIFSVIYYGFPFPNTAYAKLGTGIPRSELLTQGILYLENSFRLDPVTLLTIVVSLAVIALRGTIHARVMGMGIVFYLLYTVWVGGDFMSGRFLAAPFLIAVVLGGATLTSAPLRVRQLLLVFTVLISVASALILPSSPWRANAKYSKVEPITSGIADERGHWYPALGLRPYLMNGRKLRHRAYEAGLHARLQRVEVVRRQSIGLFGFAAGPQVRIIDTWALADPLLARLPANFTRGRWRIGHFSRRVPPGYDATVKSGVNELRDPDLREMYQSLSLITRGELFSAERWRAMWRMNRGLYRSHVERYQTRLEAVRPTQSPASLRLRLIQ